MSDSETLDCHYCGPTEKELRPYGPGGSWVCFPCATATPEREQAAKNAFGGLLDATEVVADGPVVIGGQNGPESLTSGIRRVLGDTSKTEKD